MSSTPLLICWLLGELSAGVALFGVRSDWSRLLLFVAGHGIASLCLSLVLTAALPRQVEMRRGKCMALFLSFSFFIPLLGGLGMLAILLYFRFFQRFDDRVEFSSVPMSTYMQESGGPAQGMGEGGAWSRLRNDDVPRQERLKALLAIGSGGGQNVSRLLQLATKDSDDEIRLLAFNLADRREKAISTTISETLANMRATTDPATVRLYYRQLAFSYWEMVFSDLAQHELAQFFVNQSLDYAAQALHMDGNDGGLLLLTGRLHLWRGDIATAKEKVAAALHQGIHRDRAIPYLAEIAYRQRDFVTLKSYFAQFPLLREKPGIGPVAKFWME